MAYIYPALLGLIPAINLYSKNRVAIQHAWPSWIVIFVLPSILALIIRLITSDERKAGVIAAIFAIVFFYFEPVIQQLDVVIKNLGISGSQYRLLDSYQLVVTLFIIWIILWIVAGRFILRSENITKKAVSFLIVVSLFLLITPVFKITLIVNEQKQIADSPGYTFERVVEANNDETLILSEDEINQQPDVFYLIFDAFASEETLSSIYGMDISDFIAQLEKKGFYIASESKANYSQTINSLPSSLNMNYLNELTKTVINPRSWIPLAGALQQNLVSLFLADRGYELITFSSGYWPTENIQADEKYHPRISLNEYQEVLVQNTPLVHLFPDILYDHHRNRISYTLNNLPDAGISGAPRFVFAHLFIPHPPFVFDEEGNHIHVSRFFTKYDADGYRSKGGTSSEYQKMYAAQLNYLMDQILVLVDEIIAKSDSPPIIIIQGDHGPGSMITQRNLEEGNLDERFSIMNAYYFPDKEYDNLYPGITPVNSFRIVFDQYYGTDLGLLADRNYFSTVSEPYNYSEMTEMLK